MKRLLTLAFTILPLACMSGIKTSQNIDSVKTPWKNPTINCTPPPFNNRPFVIQDGETYEATPAEFKAFCQQTNAEFQESHLTPDEALIIYALFETSGILKHESLHQPDPDANPSLDVDGNDRLSERVALKKTGENQYQIFFFKKSGGFMYVLGQFTLHPNTPISIEAKTTYQFNFTH